MANESICPGDGRNWSLRQNRYDCVSYFGCSARSLTRNVDFISIKMPLGAAGMRTLLPRLVPPHALDRANALDTAVYAVVDFIGPAVAGMIIAWLGPETALSLIAMASFDAKGCA
jgi:hypothetical protein